MKKLIEELKSLDPNNPGLWPVHIQLGMCAIVMCLLLFGGWKLDISVQREELAAEEAKELGHKETFDRKQLRAANLNALKEQMIEMKQSFGDMLRQLPSKTEIAGLIVDVSQTGLSAGLEFDLFQPQPEQPSEFYAQLPINIKVKGTYHQFGEFVSGLAQLPRIVTAHNILIQKDATDSDVLTMSAVARTYRAIEESEE